MQTYILPILAISISFISLILNYLQYLQKEIKK